MRRSHALALMAMVVVLSPVVTWWLLGDLSEDVVDPDYMIRPPDLTGGQQLMIGGGATAVAVVAVGMVFVAVRRRTVTPAEIRAVVPLLVAGAFCGLAWRILTAGVIGANIGGGMVLVFGPFFVLGMLVLSVVWWLQRSR